MSRRGRASEQLGGHCTVMIETRFVRTESSLDVGHLSGTSGFRESEFRLELQVEPLEMEQHNLLLASVHLSRASMSWTILSRATTKSEFAASRHRRAEWLARLQLALCDFLAPGARVTRRGIEFGGSGGAGGTGEANQTDMS